MKKAFHISPKLKAGSLLYAIFIAFLISSIVGSFILFLHFGRLHVLGYEGRIEAMLHLKSGFNYLLGGEEADFSQQERLLFDDDESSKTILSSQAWGLYRLAAAATIFKQDTFRKAALIANCMQAEKRPALYLTDKNQPLSLAGNARIYGDAFLPERGLKRAYIEGQSYSGKELLSGKTKRSENKLPPVKKAISSSLSMLTGQRVPSIVQELKNYNSNENLILYRSAHQAILGVVSNEAILLGEGEVEGPIIIKSQTSVRVGQNFKVKHAIIIAPNIVVESGFEGALQLLATDSLIIQENCNLQYPSAAIVFSDWENAMLQIKKGTRITGEVMLLGDEYKIKHALVQLEEEVEVTGNVYSTKKVELKGTVNGSIVTDRFYLKTKSSVYENHLLDGRINRNELPNEYVGSGLLETWSSPTKKVLAWLK